ncbi:phospholipase A(2) [Trichonephila clavipes]|nr:phospholipase A(2) [Trichonephila clavipes]
MLTGLDPTDYIPYGNWCGYGGQGKPIDLIDDCCRVHDNCYGLSEKECLDEQVHVIQYMWRINNKTVICVKFISEQGRLKMIGQLATCDDHRPRTGLVLPPYTIITQSVKRRKSV